FGAGMIKMRSDPCWRDLTCLFYHYETQPLPNPLSWYLHHSPRWMHKAGVLFTHFAQLAVPWFYFSPAPFCYWAGGLTILFQATLILSGNLSWLNYLTIVLCIPCFDDRLLERIIHISHSTPAHLSPAHAIAVGLLTALVLALSWWPVRDLFSRRQLMNASFEPLHLVNTYGAFGAVTRERPEIIIKGTDADSPDGSAEWREYEFKGKPGDVNRRPCIVSPYHWKLDWQMWFAAMSAPEFHPGAAAARGRKENPSPVRAQSVSRWATKIHSRRLVSLPVHQARRARLVEPHLSGRIFASDDTAPRRGPACQD